MTRNDMVHKFGSLLFQTQKANACLSKLPPARATGSLLSALIALVLEHKKVRSYD